MVTKNRTIDEVILHVGLHKTGTTSIQKTLFLGANNKLLAEKNYLYPTKSWYPNHSIPIYSAFCDHPENYHINIRKGYSTTEIKKINKQNLRRLETEIAKSEQSKLIISGEDISLLSLNNLLALKKYLKSISKNDVTIKVVIYVRNPISWTISSIQQIIKHGETYKNTFNIQSTFLKNLIRNRIEKFVKVFGKEYTDVYTFEGAITHNYGLVGHFLSKIGFDNSEIDKFNFIRANESISLIAADIISFINEKIPMFKDGKLHEKRFNGDINPLLDIQGPKFDIPYSDKKKLLESSRDDIKWLKDNFGIDYSKLNESETNRINYNFTEGIIRDIKKAYTSPKLSLPLRGLVIEYLQQQLKNNLNYKSKLLLKKLLDELGS